jgi:hypothetical protein
VENTEFSIHPNPSNGIIQVFVLATFDKWELTCMDLNGKALFTESQEGKEATIHLESLQSGIYILVIKANGTELKKRFILQ